MNGCIFCKIVNKEIPAKIIYEDDKMIVFHDINPMARVHVLVVPKLHIEKLIDIPEENISIVQELFLVINKVVEMLDIKQSGFRVIVNNGKDGGQMVDHLHFHVLGGECLHP